MRRLIMVASLSLPLFALAACGTNPADRAISGAGIGAGIGALGGFAFGAPGTGAALGAAVGGTAGALTKKKDIDLGKPFWRE